MKRQAIVGGIVVALLLLAGCAGQGGAADVGVTVSDTGDKVFAGTQYNVSATVANDGDIAANETIELVVDGESVATETVSLEPGAARTVTLTHTFDRGGEYAVGVADWESTVTVFEDPLTDAEAAMADIDSYGTEERWTMDLDISGNVSGEFNANRTGSRRYDRVDETARFERTDRVAILGHNVTTLEEVWYADGVRYSRERVRGESGYEYEASETSFKDVAVAYDLGFEAYDESDGRKADGEEWGISVVNRTEPEIRGDTIVYTADLSGVVTLYQGFAPAGVMSSIDGLSVEFGIDTETRRLTYQTTTMTVDGLRLGNGAVADGTVTRHIEFVEYGEPVEISVPQTVIDETDR